MFFVAIGSASELAKNIWTSYFGEIIFSRKGLFDPESIIPKLSYAPLKISKAKYHDV